MDILTYINRMNQIYGNGQQAAPVYNTQKYFNGGPVGNPTGMITEYGRKVYETPGGEKVSEKSVTLQMGDTWINVPSIHGGKMYNQAQLEQMLMSGKIQPTSTHNSEQEAVDAAMSRSDMMQSERVGHQSGQLVQPGPGRQGYGGDSVKEFTMKKEKYITKNGKVAYKPFDVVANTPKAKKKLANFAKEYRRFKSFPPTSAAAKQAGVLGTRDLYNKYFKNSFEYDTYNKSLLSIFKKKYSGSKANPLKASDVKFDVTNPGINEKQAKRLRQRYDLDPKSLKEAGRKRAGRTGDLSVAMHHGMGLNTETLGTLIADEDFAGAKGTTKNTTAETALRSFENQIDELKLNKPAEWQRKSDKLMAKLNRLKKGKEVDYSFISNKGNRINRKVKFTPQQLGLYGFKADTSTGFKGLDKSQTVAFKAGVSDELANKPLSQLNKAEQEKAINAIAKVLNKADIRCGQAKGINCNDPRAYIKSINELKSKAALGDKAALGKFRKVANAMRKFKGPLAFTGWVILGEIGFALPFAAMDYADGKSTAEIMNNASFGLFGMNEEEEAISLLPKDSQGGAVPSLLRAGERIDRLTQTPILEGPRNEYLGYKERVFPQSRMGIDQAKFKKAQAKVLSDAKLAFTDKLAPFLEGPRNEYYNPEKADKAYGEMEIAKAKLKALEEQKAKERVATPFEGIEFKEGGRVSFKGGGFTRRKFLKLLAALGIGGATAGTGLIKLGGKAATKTAVKAGVDIATSTPGMPSWFPALVNKIIKEGDDVTAKLATTDRQVVHTKKIPGGDEATVYQNLDTGNITVEYGGPLMNKKGQIMRASNDPDVIHLEYKAGEVIEEGAMKGKKTKSEFSAAEAEPEVVNWDGDIEMSGINEVNKVEDLITPTNKLQEFATGKNLNIRDRLKLEKQQKYKKKLDTDSMEQIDYIEKKHPERPTSLEDYYDDSLPDIDDID